MALSAFYGVARTTAGTIIPSAAVEVRRTADNSLATIYEDAAGVTPINNGVDFVTDSSGVFEFYAEPDRYTVLVGSGASQVSIPAEIVDGRAQVPFEDRAAFEAWVAGGGVAADGTVKSDGTVQYVASAGATAIADLPGWLPFGDVMLEHFGGVAAGFGASQTENDAAVIAAYAYSDYVIGGAGVYSFSAEWPNMSGKTFRGLGPSDTFMHFSGNSTNGLRAYHADPASTGYVSGMHLSGVNIVMAGSGHSGTALVLSDTNGSRIRDVTVQEAFGCILVEGGQNNSIDEYNLFGRSGTPGTVAGSFLLKTQVRTRPDTSVSVCFPLRVENGSMSGNSSPSNTANTENLVVVHSADSVTITNLYMAFAQNALMVVAAKDHNMAQLNLDNIYFDCTRFSSVTTPYALYVDEADTGQDLNQIAIGPGCGLANHTSAGLFVHPNSRLKRLKMDGRITGGSGDAADITGTTTGPGLTVEMASAHVAVNAGGFKVNTAESVSINATFEDCTDGTGALQLSGTILQKKLALSFANNTSDLSDTSTGATSRPQYEWLEEQSFSPTVEFGGGSTGVTYSSQEGLAVRVGSRVDFWVSIVLTSKGTSTGEMRIKGVPFSHDGFSIPCVFEGNNMTANTLVGRHVVADILTGSAPEIRVFKYQTSGTPDDDRVLLTDADVRDNSILKISGTYYTNAK